MTIVLDDDDVKKVLNMHDCISVLEDAYRDMGRGTVVNGPRRDSLMTSTRHDAYFSFKTIEGGSESLKIMAQRINCDLITTPVVDAVQRSVKVPAAPGNRYVGLIFLYSTESLELLSVMTDGHLQRMRVAGTTGLGIKHLARKDSQEAALIGSGWQAEAAAWAIADTRRLKKMRIYSSTKEKREALADRLSRDLGIDSISAVDTAPSAIKRSDIVVTATNSLSPVIKGDWIESGMHLSSITRAEYDQACWDRSDLICFTGPIGAEGYSHPSSRTWEGAGFTNGNIQGALAEERLFSTYRGKVFFLSDLLNGRGRSRRSDSEITMFQKGWGLGIEFAYVGKLVYERAIKAGLGKQIPTDWFTQTSHP